MNSWVLVASALIWLAILVTFAPCAWRTVFGTPSTADIPMAATFLLAGNRLSGMVQQAYAPDAVDLIEIVQIYSLVGGVLMFIAGRAVRLRG